MNTKEMAEGEERRTDNKQREKREIEKIGGDEAEITEKTRSEKKLNEIKE